MKKTAMLIAACAVIAFAAGCKRAGDVLATYEGGRITRGEFYDWMDARRMTRDAIVKKKDQQRSNLERIAVERLTVREARKAGFDKNEEFRFLKQLAVRNFYSQSLGRSVTSDGAFSEKAAKARIIKLVVKNYKIVNNKREQLAGAELDAAFKEKTDRALDIIKQLDKGESFEDLAKKHSDDFTKRKGGDIGYVVQGMRGEDFAKAVFAVREGEYTKEPVRIGNAIYIIQVDEVTTLTHDNIDDIIDDKGQQAGLKRRLQYNAAMQLQEKLMKAKDVEDRIDTANLADPAALLFRVGKDDFTVGDLNRLLAFIAGKRKQMGRPAMNVEDRMKREMIRRLLREEVLMREAKHRGLDKEEKFRNELGLFIDYNLASSYEAAVVTSGMGVTPQEVYEYYTKNSEQMFSRHTNEGGKPGRRTIPFNEVRENIEHRLVEMKRSEKKKAWADELLKKSKFAIDDSELEGK